MDTAFLNRTLRASLFLAGLAYLLLYYYEGGGWALGFLLGSLWSIGNLYLLRQLVSRWITVEERPWLPLAVLALFKFPLLYLAGFWVLRQTLYPVPAPLLGFGLPFAVLVLKAGGRLLLGLEGPDAGRLNRTALSKH